MTPAHRRGHNITDFVNDGSLPLLLEDLGRIAGRTVTLHERGGRRVLGPPEDAGDRADAPRYRVAEDPTNDAVIARALDDDDWSPAATRAAPTVAAIIPIRAAGSAVGAIAVAREAAHRTPPHPLLERSLTRLAEAVGELCTHRVGRRLRERELRLMLRMSSLLVAAFELDEILNVAIRSTREIMGADAGCVHLLDDDTGTLTMRAHVGLSEPFAEALAQLPADRVVDQAALAGEVVALEELPDDGSALRARALRDEGLVSKISTGVLFKGRPFGLLRLYTRSRRRFADRERRLFQAAAEQVSAAIAGAKLVESEREQRRIQRHVELAAGVQRRMLPASLPTDGPLDVAADYAAGDALGGDFYDVITSNARTTLVIGDVVGKGLPAALLMASARATLRAHVLAPDAGGPGEILSRVNDVLVDDTLSSEFVTLFIAAAEHHAEGLTLTAANAGHEPPVLLRARPGGAFDAEPIGSGGMVLGVLAGQAYDERRVTLRPGDALVAVTDGVTEAASFTGEHFGRDRLAGSLRDFLAEHPSAPASAIVKHVTWSMRRFSGIAHEPDDRTILAIRLRA